MGSSAYASRPMYSVEMFLSPECYVPHIHLDVKGALLIFLGIPGYHVPSIVIG